MTTFPPEPGPGRAAPLRPTRQRWTPDVTALPHKWPGVVIVLLLILLLWGVALEKSLPTVRIPPASDATTNEVMLPGTHAITNAPIAFEGDWFSQPLDTVTSLATDQAGGNLRFRFYGTQVAVTIRVGPEAGRAYVAIDGHPVTGLDEDEQGSYLSLRANRAADRSIVIASDLTHAEHEITISNGERGQLAISAFTVESQTPFPWVFALFFTGIILAIYVVLRTIARAAFARFGWLSDDENSRTPPPAGAPR